MRSIARVRETPIFLFLRGDWDWKSQQVFGCLFLWLLSFGQAKESNLLSVNHRRTYQFKKTNIQLHKGQHGTVASA